MTIVLCTLKETFGEKRARMLSGEEAVRAVVNGVERRGGKGLNG